VEIRNLVHNEPASALLMNMNMKNISSQEKIALFAELLTICIKLCLLKL